MLIYVAHKYGGNAENFERAKNIVHSLQTNDLENTYISPLLLFAHLRYGEIDHDSEMELCLDVLSVCDKLMIASDISDGVKQEIEFAELVGMEVERIADARE